MPKEHPTLSKPDDKVVERVMKIQELLSNNTKQLLTDEELGTLAEATRTVINMIIDLYHNEIYPEDISFELIKDVLDIYYKTKELFNK